jgi:hypothetical protein
MVGTVMYLKTETDLAFQILYEEEGVSSYWMTLRKREDTGN